MPEQTQETTAHDPNKFDLKVHHFDARGRVKKKTHYRLHVHKGVSMFERPVNSGNLFYENNEPAGRVIFTRNERNAIIGKKYDPAAEHVKYVAPMSADEKVHFENEQMRSRIAALEAEIAAVKADQETKQQPAQVTKPAAPAAKAPETKPVEKVAEKKAAPTLPEI